MGGEFNFTIGGVLSILRTLFLDTILSFDMYLTPFCNVSHKSLKGLRILARFFFLGIKQRRMSGAEIFEASWAIKRRQKSVTDDHLI